MSDRPDRLPRRPLSVETDLSVTVNGADARVESTGERLFVGVTSVADAFRAIRARPPAAAGVLDSVLVAGDLTAEFRVRDRTVAVAGSSARPGIVSRRLGTVPVELRLGGVLGAIGAEVRAAVDALSRPLE